MLRPALNQISALFEEVCPPVRSFDRPADYVAERGLGNVMRGVCSLRDPVSQTGSKSVRTRCHLGTLHEPRHGSVGNYAFLDTGEKKAFPCMLTGLLYYRQSGTREGDAEVRCCTSSPFHGLTRDDPNVAIDLLFAQEAERARPNAGQNEQTQREMGDGAIREGSVKGWNVPPGHRRNVLGFVPLLTEESTRLVDRLQVNIQSQGGSMLQANPQSVEGLSCGLGLAMPDGRKHVANVGLIYLHHRHFAELGKDVDF